MTTSKTFEVSRKRLLLWVGQSSLGNTQGVSAMPETLEGVREGFLEEEGFEVSLEERTG